MAFFAVLSFIAVDMFAGTGLIDTAVETICLHPKESVAALAVAPLTVVGLKIPQEKFDELKAKYRHLYIVNVIIDENESYQFIIRRPNKEIISAVSANKNDITKSNDILIKNMVVGGDLDCLDDGIVYSRLMGELGKIMKQGSSDFTKA
ncbi:hypothetical protein [Dysgonomonas sp. ZJ279]|uniref:hypothetical protein n=1 Tax=Dysgonomonas sp. ZJ279 TaxID=2709796 RepID=UPI0013EBAF38|nr:hypothetical protein [Dysgonomonas sp. ZJ279]